jgi:hypothetical protein
MSDDDTSGVELPTCADARVVLDGAPTKPPKSARQFVYGLIDPRTHMVFYIGQTRRGMMAPDDERTGVLRYVADA